MINNKLSNYGNEQSIIRQMWEDACEKKKILGEDKVFDFTIGNPNVACPKEVTSALINLVTNTDPVELHSYTAAPGLYDVRKAISESINKKYKASTDPNYIYITHGAASGISITLKALASSADDEVVIFAPYFPEYSMFIENAGCKKVVVKADDRFFPDFKDLEEKITPNTKAVMIDSPNNPSGVVYTEDIIIKLSDILKKKEHEYNHPIYFISDEPYRDLIYSDILYPYITNYYDNSIVIYSFSKSLSLPGERIGYVTVNKNCVNAKEVYNAIKGSARVQGYVCESSLFQKLLPFVLEAKADISFYKKNRDILYDGLTSLGYEIIKPEGAFYMFVKALEPDAYKFSLCAKDYNLYLVPSDSFGVTGYVRVSYCVSTEQIINSLPAFKELMKHYKEN